LGCERALKELCKGFELTKIRIALDEERGELWGGRILCFEPGKKGF